MTPIQILGPFIAWLSNDVQYQLLREVGAKNGSSYMVKTFICPSCDTSMNYAHLHAHLVKKHKLHIGLANPDGHIGLDLASWMSLMSAADEIGVDTV